MKWVYGALGEAQERRAWQDEGGWGWQERPTITVWEEDTGAVKTGLLDAAGRPLYRYPNREPIGFRHRVVES